MALVPFKNADEDKPALGYYDGEPPELPEDDDALDGRMSFLDHLDELRKRLTHAIVALLVGFVGAFTFAGRAQEFVMRPLVATLPPGAEFVFTEPGEQFFLYIKIAAIVGLMIASPYVMLQVWWFVAPGLYANEKRLAVPFVFFSSALFIAGAAFSHYLAFPMAFQFFASFQTPQVRFLPRIAPVFSMYRLAAAGPWCDVPTAHAGDGAGPARPGHRRLPRPQHQVRRVDHLHRRRRGLTGRRPGEPDGHRRPDAGALRDQHRRGVDPPEEAGRRGRGQGQGLGAGGWGLAALSVLPWMAPPPPGLCLPPFMDRHANG